MFVVLAQVSIMGRLHILYSAAPMASKTCMPFEPIRNIGSAGKLIEGIN